MGSPSYNRLKNETSPYLLQHQDNPVHWWAWGIDALAEAKRTNKPILLSVGYAACHWCHVMAHESFEDDATAELMNKLFVNIKVDREERPDIDAIYMDALHMMGEQGGWPLTMFLTPKGEPFWGGTYFPKTSQYGRPSFQAVLKEIARIYEQEPKTVQQNSTVLTQHLQQNAKIINDSGDSVTFTFDDLEDTANKLVEIIDTKRGGVHGAPKFPQVSLFDFLWRMGVRSKNEALKLAVDVSLKNICQGGIYDHLGGGFARYSVDDRWLVPHFEKMLYDNGQLLGLMCEVWKETKDLILRERIFETAEWVLTEMIGEGGGFASSLDADSEGVEGKFYVWDKDEVIDVLTADGLGDIAPRFCEIYDVHEGGNWEGKTILNRLEAMAWIQEDGQEDMETILAKCRKSLLKARSRRIRPSWDDKILSDWNGLIIPTLAQAGDLFGQQDWIDASVRAFDFICGAMMVEGRLSHSYREGQRKAPATSSDYANMIAAAVSLFQITSEEKYLEQAKAWVAVLDQHYWDQDHGGYFVTADDTDDVLVRQKSAHDDATPNANGVMVSNLMALFVLTGEASYQQRADQLVNMFSRSAQRNLFAHSRFLSGVLDVLLPIHIVLVGQDQEKLQTFKDMIHNVSLPGAVVQVLSDVSMISQSSPAFEKTKNAKDATAYVCVGTMCLEPVTDVKVFRENLLTAQGLKS